MDDIKVIHLRRFHFVFGKVLFGSPEVGALFAPFLSQKAQ